MASLNAKDSLLHVKINENEDTILFPITRYDNVLNTPKVVSDSSNFNGAPFYFYKTETVSIEEEDLNTLVFPGGGYY